MSSNRYPHLLSPGRIGSLETRNRIAVAAMGVSFSEDDGSVGDKLIAYHEAQAKGGVGLIISGVCSVAWPIGAAAMGQTAISEDKYIPGLKALTDRVHAHGAKIAAQLHMGGLVAGYAHARWGHPLMCPAIPPAPTGSFFQFFLEEELGGIGGFKPPELKVMDQADIDWLVGKFAEGARRAVEAGFDAIEIHGGHGYIISSFLSPYTNTRTDNYGGSHENRMRLATEIITAIRNEVGREFPVWIKLDGIEVGKPGGIQVADAIEHARLAEKAGVDAITVTSYHDTSVGKLHSESNIPHIEDWNMPAAAAIRAAVSIPVIAAGRVEPESGDKAIGEGKADFIAMGRKLLADPELPNKLTAGDPDKVRPCVYCYTCVSAIYVGDPARCAVNPTLGVEFLHKQATAAPKRVVVVGGGPGGMEATRRLTAAGHHVTLFEQSERLGGTVRFAGLAYEPNERLLNWLTREVEASGSDIRLGTAASVEAVKSLNPDHVIVATGAVRGMPPIPGNDLPHVFSGDDMRKMMFGETSEELKKKTSLFTRLATKVGAATGASANLDLVRKATKAWMPLGDKVVIIGGELVGVELAEFLAERGRTVNVVDDVSRFGKGLTLVRRMRILTELADHGVGLHAGAGNIAITSDAVTFTDAAGVAQSVPADTVIVAKGATGDLSLAEQMQAAGLAVHAIGDANGVGYIEGAMRQAYEATQAIVV